MDGPIKVTRYVSLFTLGRLSFSPTLRKRISECAGDILHLHVPNPAMILCLLFGRPPKVSLVVTYHSDHVNQPVRAFFFRPFEYLLYAGVDKIIATTQTYKNSSSLLRKFKNVVIIPIGIPIESLANPVAEQKARAKELLNKFEGPLWLTCSRLVHYKGIEYAVLAMKQAPGTLLVLGDGPDRDRLTELVLEHQLSKKVRFLGFQDDLLPYFLSVTALWLPSINRAEAFGVIQLEAMAAGCPVINCSIKGSGVQEVSIEGETGLTVAPRDPKALATAALRLHEDRELRSRFAANGAKRVQEKFQIDSCRDEIYQVYKDVQAARAGKTLANGGKKSAEMKTKLLPITGKVEERSKTSAAHR